MTDNTTSAREYRVATRDAQQINSHLQLIHQISTYIAKHGSEEATLQKIIVAVSNFSNVENGLIALDCAGNYKVKASIGASLAVGARVPASVIANLNLSALSAINFSAQENRLWLIAHAGLQTEWVIPIKISMQIVGFIALSANDYVPPFSESEQQTLLSLATIVGLCGSNTRVEPSQENMMALALLTSREKEVFKLLPSGLTNAEIGAKLGIATGTAKIHVERILSKLGLSDRTQAAVRASELGYHLE